MNNQKCFDEAIELTKMLIAIDTSNRQGLRTARQKLLAWSKVRSLSARRIPKTKALLIETNPLAPKTFAFVCHTDVVPADGWETAFAPVIKKGALYGRGAVDDKGPLAICLAVLHAWKNEPNINVSCLIVSDEEVVNLDIQGVLSSQQFKADYCLVVDGGTHQLFDIGQKGIVRLSANVTAIGGHSAFEEGSKSASLKFLRFIKELESFGQTLPTDPHFKPTFINVSRLQTATVPYGLPTKAEANLEIQFPPPQTLEQWLAKIKQLQTEIPHLKVKIYFTEVPHLVTDQRVLGLIKRLPNVSLITVGGVNLAKDLNKAGIPAVGHCPVKNYMGHCDDENIKLSDFKKGIKTYNKLIKMWLLLE